MQPQELQNQPLNQPTEGGEMKTPGNPTGKEHVFDKKAIAGAVIGGVLGVVAVAGGIVLTMHFLNNNKPVEPKPEPVAPIVEPEPAVPEFLNLQEAVDKWVTENSSNNVGVIIKDLDNDQIAARHNEDTKFRIESIYKMFVAYEGYTRIDKKTWKANDTYAIANDYENKPYTRAKCLDHMIRFSYSPCAEIMWGEIGHDNLQGIWNARGFKNTSIQGLTSTPSDLMKLYEIYWEHNDLSEESWSKIKDSMLNQIAPTKDTRYNHPWRQGLPSGFATAKVYDKVGWYGGDRWYFYDDAAFVVFPETKDKDTGKTRPERHYIVIALTKDTDAKKLVELGRKIELAVKTADNYK